MAYNSKPFFRNAEQVTDSRYEVTTSLSDVFASDATYLRDLVKLTCINVNASARTLTLYESDGTNDDIVHVISIPGNSGQAAGAPAIDLLNNIDYKLSSGLRIDPYGNYYFRLATGKKLRALASATSSLILLFDIESYQE